MVFSSLEFVLVFFPIVFSVYFFLNKKRVISGSKYWLVLSSLFLQLLECQLSTINFVFYFRKFLYLESSQRLRKLSLRIRSKKNLYLMFGIFFNLSLLCYFKYLDFFTETSICCPVLILYFSTMLSLLQSVFLPCSKLLLLLTPTKASSLNVIS